MASSISITKLLGESAKTLNNLLTGSQKRTFGLLLVLQVITASLDVFGFIAIIPVVIMVLDPDFIHESQKLAALYEFTGLNDEKKFAVLLLGLLVLFFLVKNAAALFLAGLQAKFAQNVTINLSERQFINYFTKDLTFFKESPAGKLITNLVGVPINFSIGIMLTMINLISEACVFLTVLGFIGYLNYTQFGNFWLLVIIGLILGPTGVLILVITNRKNTEVGQIKLEQNPIVYSGLMQAIIGNDEIRVSNSVGAFKEKFKNSLNELIRAMTMPFILNQVPLKAMEIILVSGVTIIMLYALYWTDDPSKMGTFLLFLAVSAFRIMPSLNRSLTAIMTIRQSHWTIPVLRDLVNLKDANLNDDVAPLKFEKEVRLKDIGFAFEDAEKPIFEGLNISFQKGEVVGVIGRSGSGKTTLINLLLRFFKESAGNILVDGKVLTDSDVNAWRANIGYVKQNVFILDTDIRENIAFGKKREEIDEERLQFAIKNARLEGFVNSLENGLDTRIGELGSKISGGQKQRIGIARALYKNAEIIIMDEATSSLDPKTESEITETINSLKNVNRTVLVIAHRVTTLKYCDRIIEMGNGKVLGEAKYDEIAKRAEEYHNRSSDEL